MTDYLPIALRAFTPRLDPEPGSAKRRWRRRILRPVEYVLVFDTETTIDRAQRLLFGSYRFYRVEWDGGRPTLRCLDEALFYDDQLPASDPEGFETLRTYVREHPSAVDPELPLETSISLGLMPRSVFAERLFQAAYKVRATVACFNYPFDISRLALWWDPARVKGFEAGFSLTLFEYEDDDGLPRKDPYRTRFLVKTIDAKRALKALSARAEADPVDLIPEGSGTGKTGHGEPFRGHLLDLRTLAFSLTDRGYTLERAVQDFVDPDYREANVEHGQITPDYIAYNRTDVGMTARLYEALATEHGRHPIDLQATKAYSPASIGKAYLKAMGVRPILERQPSFPRDVLGRAMTTYYGGRAECRIRRHPVPVVYLDFLSMYPTVNALLRLWKHVTARQIDVSDDTERVRALVERIEPSDCLRPDTWRDIGVTLVELEPDGEPLPVRARYSDTRSWSIGVNNLHSREPLWYALPDVIAAKLLDRRTPPIRRALRLVPVGRQRGLKPVRLRGDVAIDPRKRDLFQAVIEERRALTDRNSPLGRFLKTFANASSYGIYAETNRHELGGERKAEVTVHGFDDEPFTTRVGAPEEPGPFCFPPLAATITAGARLMLALLERLVKDAGGEYVFCDTDSMAIVASEHGGLVECPGGSGRTSEGEKAIRALSWKQVDEIVEQFAALNPYDAGVVGGSILEIEEENFDQDAGGRRQLYCYAISAKRYALYNRDENGEPVLRKWSEHGLGHLLNPTDPEDESRDWIKQLWDYIVRRDALELPADEPVWLDRPALTRTTISTPRLLAAFQAINRGKPPHEQVRPYNFLLTAHVAKLGHPPSADPEHFQLVAAYSSDPRQWRKLVWVNKHDPSGRRYRITTTGQGGETTVRVKTYRDVLTEYRANPEPKSLGPDGEPCSRRTKGLLERRAVRPLTITYIGKEADKLEEREADLVHDLDDAVTEYADPTRAAFVRLVVPVVRELPVAKTAADTDISERTIKAVRSGHTMPHSAIRAALTAYSAEHARRKLRAARVDPQRGDLAALAKFLDFRANQGLRCRECGEPLTGRQRQWCSDACRQLSARRERGSPRGARRPQEVRNN